MNEPAEDLPKTTLVRLTTIENVEASGSVPVNDADWVAFRDRIGEGDELWEYEFLVIRMGFAGGSSGVAIVRAGQILQTFATSAYG